MLRTLEALDQRGRGGEAARRYRLVTQYVRKNAYRMDYPSYQAKGWQIGSGAMESSCKTVICQRLRRWDALGRGWDPTPCLISALLFQSEPNQWEAFWSQNRN